jgi:hypothetical protein
VLLTSLLSKPWKQKDLLLLFQTQTLYIVDLAQCSCEYKCS